MADTTIVIPSGSDLEMELERAADASGSTKSDVIMLALSEWLSEQSEISEVLSRIEAGEPTYSIEEVKKSTMAWTIRFLRVAEKDLSRIDRVWQRRILAYLETDVATAADPRD